MQTHTDLLSTPSTPVCTRRCTQMHTILHLNGSHQRFCTVSKGQKDDKHKSWESTFAAPLEHATHHSTLPDAFSEQGIVHASPRNKARYGSCIKGYDSWPAGPAAAESLDGTASLKPEPSICHSGFDPLDCRDGDHSSGGHRID
jgi:hypothetical protein